MNNHWVCNADCYQSTGGVATCPTDMPPGVSANVACLGENEVYSGGCLLVCDGDPASCGPMACVYLSPGNRSTCMWEIHE